MYLRFYCLIQYKPIRLNLQLLGGESQNLQKLSRAKSLLNACCKMVLNFLSFELMLDFEVSSTRIP